VGRCLSAAAPCEGEHRQAGHAVAGPDVPIPRVARISSSRR
jgi:hypothetical protein